MIYQKWHQMNLVRTDSISYIKIELFISFFHVFLNFYRLLFFYWKIHELINEKTYQFSSNCKVYNKSLSQKGTEVRVI